MASQLLEKVELPVGAGGNADGKGEAHASMSESGAAVKVQKVFRSHRARRELADSSMVSEDLWWQTIYHAKLDHSTSGFFDSPKAESAASKWYRVGSHASKVGKGISRDSSALKLFFQHWIEAIDPKHRYGMSLYLYYEAWSNADSKQPFFYWLDVGDGKDVDLEACPRSKLHQQCVKYLSPRERQQYEYVIQEGKLTNKLSGDLMDTNKTRWIFVMSTSKKLYSGAKIKGKFHHSSFLAGGATLAAGSGEWNSQGSIPSSRYIFPHSGHYRPLEDHYNTFLNYLTDGGIDLDNVEIGKITHTPYFDRTNTTVVTPSSHGSSRTSQANQPETLNVFDKPLVVDLQNPPTAA